MRRPSALEPVAGLLVDRDDARRSLPELFDVLLADSATRILSVSRGRVLLADASHEALALLEPDRVTSAQQRVYLGLTAAGPVIAVSLSDAAAAELEPAESRWASPREVAAKLDELEYSLAVEALAILNWHESHPFCPRCGMPTVVERGGWVRRCFNDDREVFPRTDPAVIVRVLDASDRILLGSNRMWESNRWSLFAGFVEPGEAFEQAVLREVEEESGVSVTAPRYLGSQPWPFPASIMIGFEAHTVEDAPTPVPDGEEIVEARWFTRDELWAGRGEVLLPGEASIAHAIIADWYGGPLDAPPPGR